MENRTKLMNMLAMIRDEIEIKRAVIESLSPGTVNSSLDELNSGIARNLEEMEYIMQLNPELAELERKEMILMEQLQNDDVVAAAPVVAPPSHKFYSPKPTPKPKPCLPTPEGTQLDKETTDHVEETLYAKYITAVERMKVMTKNQARDHLRHRQIADDGIVWYLAEYLHQRRIDFPYKITYYNYMGGMMCEIMFPRLDKTFTSHQNKNHIYARGEATLAALRYLYGGKRFMDYVDDYLDKIYPNPS
jgi:hypothetical protein